MTALILPDRKLETMEGYYPERKPVGNVKIDTDNHLIADKYYVNLMNGKEPGSIETAITRSMTAKGKATSFSSVSKIELNGHTELLTPRKTFTVFARVASNSDLTAANRGIFTPPLTINQGGWLLIINAGKVRFYVYHAGGWTFVETPEIITVGEVVNISADFNGASISLYVNGVLQASTTTITYPLYVEPFTKNAAIGVYPIHYTTENSFIGDIHMVGLTHRNWSAVQHKHFNHAPYQFLIPA